MRCDFIIVLASAAGELTFQSLSGFLMRCDGGARYGVQEEVYKFQSLSGFLMRCDAGAASIGIVYPISFNPYRVF